MTCVVIGAQEAKLAGESPTCSLRPRSVNKRIIVQLLLHASFLPFLPWTLTHQGKVQLAPSLCLSPTGSTRDRR